MKICVTGGIGSGKSRVVEILQRHGEFVVQADRVNAEMLTDPTYVKKLVELFPSAVQCGVVDRAIIKQEIAVSEQKRLALNELSHDEIYARMQEKASQVERAFFEVPMLDDAHANVFDKIWFVSARDEVRVRRIVARDGVSETVAKRFIEVQRPYDVIKHKASAIIHNDGESDLEAEVLKLLRGLKVQG